MSQDPLELSHHWTETSYIPRIPLVKQLLEIASEPVSIRSVYADAEFDGTGAIHDIEELHLSYLIWKPSDERIKHFVARMGYSVAIKQNHGIKTTVQAGTATVTPTSSGFLQRMMKSG